MNFLGSIRLSLTLTVILYLVTGVLTRIKTSPKQIYKGQPIFEASCGLVVNVGPDKIACEDNPTVVLEGAVSGPGLREFYWEPPEGLSNERILRPTVDVTGPACYTLVGKKKSDVNLVVNGDFSAGNTGFTTGYTLSANLLPEGTYGIFTSPHLGLGGWAVCGDHTTGSGPMMLMNGSVSGAPVWCQTIAVKPNHDYCVFGWAMTAMPVSPAVLDFTINGEIVGGINLSSTTCLWEQMSGTWNSGPSTVATYCITNLNREPFGNDFAIDDLAMYEICEQRDTVCVDLITIDAFINPPPMVCCQQPVVSLDGTGSSFGPDYSYCWEVSNGGRVLSGGTTLNPLIDRPGTYKLTVKGPGGCKKEVEVDVEGNINPPRAIANVIDTLECANPSVRILGGAVPSDDITYEWTGPNGFNSGNQSPTVEDTGKYTLTVTDECGCSSTACITVYGRDNIIETSIEGDSLGCDKQQVNLLAMTNNPMVDYEWTGPNGGLGDSTMVTVSDTGWYFLLTSSEEGCETIDSFFVGADFNIPQGQISSDTITCDNPMITLTVTSDSSNQLEWRKNGIPISSDTNVQVASGGTYELTITGENGCADTLTYEVPVDTTSPSVNIIQDSIDCGEDSISICIDTSNGNTVPVMWNGLNVIGEMGTCITIGSEGWYRASQTADNGCTSIDSVFIKKKQDHPSESFGTITLDCNRPIQNVRSQSVGSDMVWTGPDGTVISQDSIMVDMIGFYHYTISSNQFECPYVDSFEVIGDFDKPLGVVNTDTLTCLVDSVIVVVESNDDIAGFIWNGPSGLISTDSSIVLRTAGQYFVIIEGLNGCIDTIPFDVNQADDFPIVDLNTDTINCDQPNVDIVLTANRSDLNYLWTGPGVSGQTDSTVNTNVGGSFSVLITSPEGCEVTKTINVVVDTISPDVMIDLPDTITCIQTNVELNISTGGGQEIRMIEWTGPGGSLGNNPAIMVGTPGSYSARVVGKNGCVTTQIIEVMSDTISPNVMIQGDTVTCLRPEVTLVASSNADNGNIEWSGPTGMSSGVDSILTSTGGTYQVTVTAENGCVSIATYNVEVDTIQPTISVMDDTLNCYEPTLNLIANYDADQTPIWDGPGLLQFEGDSISTTIAGNYQVTVRNDNGCETTIDFFIIADTTSPIIMVRDTFLTCADPEIEIVGSHESGTTVTWTDEAGQMLSSTNTFMTTEPGQYIFTATNSNNGCSSSATITVKDFRDIPIADLEIVQPDCDVEVGSIRVTQVTGGSGSYTYSLDGVEFGVTSDFGLLPPGTYVLYTMDENGCVNTDTIQIHRIQSITVELDTEIEIELGEEAQLDLQISPDLGAVRSIKWTPSEGLSCTDCVDPIASPGVNRKYLVEVTDTNGCVTIREILIKVEGPKVFIPNVFSPNNGDGINDKFIPYVSNPEKVTVNYLRIYSRWGELIHEDVDFNPNDRAFGWDGRFNGERMGPGVYVYSLEIEFPDGQTTLFSGGVTVLD